MYVVTPHDVFGQKYLDPPQKSAKIWAKNAKNGPKWASNRKMGRFSKKESVKYFKNAMKLLIYI